MTNILIPKWIQWFSSEFLNNCNQYSEGTNKRPCWPAPKLVQCSPLPTQNYVK